MDASSSPQQSEELPEDGGASAARPEQIRFALLAIWFAFMASSTVWVPIYRGTASAEGLVVVYALLAGSAGLRVKERAPTTEDAIVAALPSILLMAIAGFAAGLQNEANEGRFGEPLFLYSGVALLASWAIFVVATAIGSQIRWNRMGGLLLGLAVAMVGWGLMTLQFN